MRPLRGVGVMMRVDELIQLLSAMDPKAPVTLWEDGELRDAQSVTVINQIQANRDQRSPKTVVLS
jgi:hypothetical protein